ncbi:MAG TPA: replication initiator protein A [bacterium]|nr:replication initiator protein A [bacterium]
MAKEKNIPQTTGIVSYKAPTPKVEEEIYNLQDDSALIQYEMNMIELPFFTRDKNVGEAIIKKYVFSGNQYMEVIPSSDKSSGYKIPQEFDEKIFYAIMQLYRKQGEKRIVTTMYELLKLAGYGYGKKEYDRVKQSLDRLKDTVYVFNGIIYDKKNNRIVKDRVRKNILQSSGVREFSDLNKEELENFGREIPGKSVVVIEISDFIEENIAAKGFLYYDAEKLLDVTNSTARKLYLLISKWQGWEKSDTIRRSCNFLASRIPLSWEKSNIPGTINVLEKASEELKEKGMIGGYVLNRRKPLSESEIIFMFQGATETARSKAIMNANLDLSTETGHEGIVIDAVRDEFLDDRQTSIFDTPGFRETEILLSLLPEEYRTETNRKTIERFLAKGSEHIKSNIRYTLKNCNGNFEAYLNKALSGDWAASDREKAELEREKKHKEQIEAEKKTEDLRKKATEIYKNLKDDGLNKMHREAEHSTYYRFSFEDRVNKGEIEKKEALREVALVLISGRIDK